MNRDRLFPRLIGRRHLTLKCANTTRNHRGSSRKRLNGFEPLTSLPDHVELGRLDEADDLRMQHPLRQAHTIGALRIIIAPPLSSEGLWRAVLDPLRRATP